MMRKFLHIFYFQDDYMFYWRFHFSLKAQSIAYLLSGSEHVYWTLNLEIEVHSIWVLWPRQPSRMEWLGFSGSWVWREVFFGGTKKIVDYSLVFPWASLAMGFNWSSLLFKCVKDVACKSSHNNVYKRNERFNLYMFNVIYMWHVPCVITMYTK